MPDIRTRKPYLLYKLFGVLIIPFLLFCSRAETSAEESRYSILLVTLDTTRADHLGSYGSNAGLTPNLDQVAAEGVTFTEARTQIPITLPSHTSMMTGLGVLEHGIRENGTFVLSDSAKTLAETLREVGYQTAGFVSAFVLDRRFGISQGFETYDDEMTDLPREKPWQGHEVDRFERSADATTERALRWLKRRDHEAPFFLWVHYFDAHYSYRAPQRFVRPGRTRYASEVAFVDSEFRELLEGARLSAKDLLVVIASDHGESLGEHDIYGHGQDLFEPAMRTVLILGGHRDLPQGARPDLRCGLQDVPATIAGLLKLDAAFPGNDLLSASRTPRNPIYMETLLPALRFNRSEMRGLIDEDWKLIESMPVGHPELRSTQLFNLSRDPEESNDLSKVESGRLERMSKKLRERVASDKGDGSTSNAAEVSEETMRMLRALGYAEE